MFGKTLTLCCARCGEVFETKIPSRRYCSERCRDESRQERLRKTRARSLARADGAGPSLAQIAKEAREAGMTYGRYVEMLRRGDRD